MVDEQQQPPAQRSSFEFRVWGSHDAARHALAGCSEKRSFERVEDCYLLVDEFTWNAKIRKEGLKIKRLVSVVDGFEQWAADRHRCDETAPSPFRTVLDRLRSARAECGTSYGSAGLLASLGRDAGVLAVFVSKNRRKFRVGDLRAEATDITVRETGKVLSTMSIQGADLDELRALREYLGLRAEENLAVHRALYAHLGARNVSNGEARRRPGQSAFATAYV